MLTLACSQIVYSIIYQWTPVTGGSNGLSGSDACAFWKL